jgi:hypothetical protein
MILERLALFSQSSLVAVSADFLFQPISDRSNFDLGVGHR